VVLEQTRKAVIHVPAEESTVRYFPGALGSLSTELKVINALSKRGYTKDNTLFATSTCPDEVNSKPGEIVDLFKNHYGENFALGGLGGIPFTGRAGFGAYSHHAAEGGKLFIMFAPHVGVEFDGQVGKLQRANQKSVSTACGAAIGAFKSLINNKQEEGVYGIKDGTSDYFDVQINFIKRKLASRLGEVGLSQDKYAYVTYQMYSIVREYFINELLKADVFDFANEVTVLGGIMVNRGQGGDRFQPLMFQSATKEEGSAVDLFEETFGPKPVKAVQDVIGSNNINVFDYSIKLTSQQNDRRYLEIIRNAKSGRLISGEKASCYELKNFIEQDELTVAYEKGKLAGLDLVSDKEDIAQTRMIVEETQKKIENQVNRLRGLQNSKGCIVDLN